MFSKEQIEEFCKNMCNRYDRKNKFNEEELKFMAFNSIEEREREENRWTRDIESIFKCDDRYFLILWERGLTEYQENYFDNQPIEVKLHEYETVVKIREWMPVIKSTIL